MRYKMRWRQEGDTTIEAKDDEQAKDMLRELLEATDMPGFHNRETEYEEPDILSCEEVGE